MGKVTKNLVYNWAGFFLNILIVIILTPFIVHTLGEKMYGIWAIILSVTGYFTILNFGAYNSVVKYISQFKAEGNHEKMSHVASGCFTLFSMVGVFIALAAIPVAFYFPALFKVAADYQSVSIVVFIVLLQLAVEFPLRVFKSILSGMQRYDITNIAFMLSLIARSALIVICLKMGFGLMAIACACLATNTIANGALYVYVRIKYPQLRIRFSKPPSYIISKLFNYSAWMFVMFICWQLMVNSSTIIVGVVMSAEAVTFFVVASRFILYLKGLIMTSIEVLVPAVSELSAKGYHDKIENITYTSSKFLFLLTLPLGLFAVFFSKPFFILWLGEQFAVSSNILIILAVSNALALGLYGVRAVVFGIGKLRVLTLLVIAETLCMLVLSVILTKTTGLIGLALAIAVSTAIFEIIVLPVYMFRLLKIPLLKYIRVSLSLPVICTIVLAGFLTLLRYFGYPHSWFHLFAHIILALLVYAVSVAVIGWRQEDTREVFKRFMPAFIRTR